MAWLGEDQLAFRLRMQFGLEAKLGGFCTVDARVVPDFLIGMKCDLIFGMCKNQAHPDISDFASRRHQAHPDISDFFRAQHPDLRIHPDEAPSEHPH